MDKALRWMVLAMCASACSGGEPEPKVAAREESASSTQAAPRPMPADAGKTPAAEDAAIVLRTFAERLLKDDLPGARAQLRVPEELRDSQVDFFLQELQEPEILTMAGVDAVLQMEFGPLAERFGTQAAHVAGKLGLELASVYAFGDTDAAALLYWDGSRFWVAALHQLAGP